MKKEIREVFSGY
jgi:hypothetical protein